MTEGLISVLMATCAISLVGAGECMYTPIPGCA